MNKTVLVTGAAGQLGQSLRSISQLYPDHVFTFKDRHELDIGDVEKVASYLGSNHFDAIVNCAAYTAVDNAEVEVDAAEQVNHIGASALAKAAQHQGALLVHISTDYVYSGKHCRPVTEKTEPEPINSYGRTKHRGDIAVVESGVRGIIVRTGWVYSEFRSNFVRTMLRLGRERGKLDVVYDQIGTPTYATDLARAIMTLIAKSQASGDKESGVELYHFSNEGVCSWYDFATTIFELAEIGCDVMPILSEHYPTPALRPYYSVLDKTKFKESTGSKVPFWKDSLKVCLQRIEEHVID